MEWTTFDKCTEAIQKSIATSLFEAFEQNFKDNDVTTTDAAFLHLQQRFGGKSWNALHVASADNAAAGWTGCAAIDFEFPKGCTPCIGYIYVKPESRHAGHGTAILEHVTALIKKQGLSIAFVWCDIELLDFYTKRGWIKTDVTSNSKVVFLSKYFF